MLNRIYELCHAKNLSLGFYNQVQHKLGCTTQKMARGLKFWFKVGEELFYLCNKNKGADQLLSLCFYMQKSGFVMTWFISLVVRKPVFGVSDQV